MSSPRRSRAERAKASSKLDWSLVDAGLAAVPEPYLNERFYPLKHVVEVFSAEDPEAMTLDVREKSKSHAWPCACMCAWPFSLTKFIIPQLREKEDRLIELVDLVVQGYHPGFARSIQNFSLILQLFMEATSQVQVMKKATKEATRTLLAQSRSLMSQWKRKVSLESSVQLLDQVSTKTLCTIHNHLAADALLLYQYPQVVEAVKYPARIEAALESKDFKLAVDLLSASCYELTHGDLARVMALRKLRWGIASGSFRV
jgi:hypothetical protein